MVVSYFVYKTANKRCIYKLLIFQKKILVLITQNHARKRMFLRILREISWVVASCKNTKKGAE